MTPGELQAATSFLLGRTHGGIKAIVDSETDCNSKLKMLDELEFELRKDIERIYYPSEIWRPNPQGVQD